MKTATALTIFMLGVSLLVADTLQIGAFTLPYRFEDTNITDIVRYVVTNDIIAYSTPIAAFRPPYQDKYGNICVQRINIPPIIDRSELFNDGIKFYIENGQTNCIIKQSLTDAAKAGIEPVYMTEQEAISYQNEMYRQNGFDEIF